MKTIELILPIPPTINHYYGGNGSRRFMKPVGVIFREEVMWLVKAAKIKPMTGRLWVLARLHFPDRRQTDIDNRAKALLDALQHAGVYANDSQIDDLQMKRDLIVNGGRCVVMIGEINAEQK